MAKTFGRWGYFVGKNPGLTFGVSFFILGLLISCFAFVENYADSLFSWVPQNGWIKESRERAIDAYSATYGSIGFIIKSKQSSLLTLNSFNDILGLTNAIYNAEYKNDDGDSFTLRDFCLTNGYGYCIPSWHPLVFYDTYSSNMFDLTGVTSDSQIVTKVQTGQSVKNTGGTLYFP